MTFTKYGTLGCSILLALTGCANWGETEPVLGNGGPSPYQPAPSQEQPRTILVSNPVQHKTVEESPAKGSRELAGFRADLEALREEQKLLNARILGLEQDNIRKDAQIKELQSLLDEMDKRSADVDKNWRARMNELSGTIDKERVARQKELETFGKMLIREIDKSTPAAPPAPTAISTITVSKGDTLIGIAAAAQTTTAEIKRLNNLKSDTIYIGQTLKVPVK